MDLHHHAPIGPRPLPGGQRLGVCLVAVALLMPTFLPAQTPPAPAPRPSEDARAPTPSSSASSQTNSGDTGTDAPPGSTDEQPVNVEALAAQIEELRRRVEVLAAELDRWRSGEEERVLPERRRQALGLAPSAAATYRRREGVSIAGYGEVLFEQFGDRLQNGFVSPKGAQLDMLRAVVYAGYRFSERFVFNSEIELEHANEISVEFAYVDYLLSDRLTLRGGTVLLPLGLVNEFHEPTVFLGARRSETETRLIPSTWRENGVGVLGTLGRADYRAYVVNGLNAAGFTADGLRGGRQKGSRARASDLAFAGRADVAPTAGVLLGGAVYTGEADQGQFMNDGEPISVRTTITELHGQAQLRGIDLRGLYARAFLGGSGELSRARGFSSTNAVGSRLEGGYVQLGYNVFAPYTDRVALMPYYRFERLDTHARVPAGFVRDPARASTFHTIGLEFKPAIGIVVKADYQIGRNQAGTGRNQFNLALGYAF